MKIKMHNKHYFYKKSKFEFALKPYIFIIMENNIKTIMDEETIFNSHNKLKNRATYFYRSINKSWQKVSIKIIFIFL